MRAIKFRAKTINEGEWVYGMTISHGTIARKSDKLYMEVGPDKWKGIDPDTVGQFTGLLDKNGKEIYEGDILAIPSVYDEPDETVIFDDGCFAVYDGKFKTAFGNAVSTIRTVIGNIHDNPEH